MAALDRLKEDARVAFFSRARLSLRWQRLQPVLLVSWLLMLTACAHLGALAGKVSTPVIVDQSTLTSREEITLNRGERMTILGYPSAAIAISDDDILQVDTSDLNPEKDSPLQTTYTAIESGATEVIVTQSLCEGIAVCGGPALYYHLQVHVR